MQGETVNAQSVIANAGRDAGRNPVLLLARMGKAAALRTPNEVS
jgi:hypothetical protein